MGQQQLILIVLSVIVVAIAVVVGMNLFTGIAADANRDQVVNDLVNFAAKAQQYYRRPSAVGGGGNTFDSFNIYSADSANENGDYIVLTTEPSGTTRTETKSVPPYGTGSQVIYILGFGREKGVDNINPMKMYVEVTAEDYRIYKLN